MKSYYILFTFLFLIAQISLAQNTDPVLWYRQPAANWDEALPIGNGRLGTMVFGGIEQERLQLNEESVWSKGGVNLEKKGGAKYLKDIRQLLFDGKYAAGQKMCKDKLLGMRLDGGTNTYQTLGDLTFNFQGLNKIRNYKRELQLKNALAVTSFTTGKVNHKRTVFSSAVDQALVMLAEADQAGQISCKVILSRPGDGEQITVEDGLLVMTQQVNKGVTYVTKIRFINQGGSLKFDGTNVIVENADKLEVRLVAATDYNNNNPDNKCDEYLKLSATKNYRLLLDDHIKEYQSYFNRVEFTLPKTEAAAFATDDRIEAQKRGVYDPSLISLYFDYGRYLLISSSRPGCMPANLQGIWADGLRPPWNSDYHININLQMNYWPVEITNLSECHIPFIEYLGELRENGRITAQELYGCEGFVAHHASDAWHFTTAIGEPMYGMWPMGAAWCATHIWEHYLFTGDKEFLTDLGYPILKEATLFISDFLVKNPNTGKLVTGPSMSPENVFLTPEGEKASVCMGPAMDLEISRHVMTSCIKASEVLNVDEKFRKKLQSQLENLTPVKIGEDGRILEWSDENLKEAMPGHRHISHLYGLYPSNEFNWNDTPEYMKASIKVLDERLKNGGGHTGWSRAWIINFYARLMDKENIWKNINALLAKSTNPNMLDNHPPFQIDGNFGGTAGIAEMLLQSHSGELNILPCLPKELPNGKIKGLMARGGHEVDIEWEDGNLKELHVKSRLGEPCKVRYGAKVIEFSMKKGDEIQLNNDLKEL